MSYISSLDSIKENINEAGVPSEFIFVEEYLRDFVEEHTWKTPSALVRFVSAKPNIFGVAGVTTDVYWLFEIFLVQQESSEQYDVLGTDDSLLKLAAAIEAQLWNNALNTNGLTPYCGYEGLYSGLPGLYSGGRTNASGVNFIRHISTEQSDEFEPAKALRLEFEVYETRGIC